jgi:hypothetical protein
MGNCAGRAATRFRTTIVLRINDKSMVSIFTITMLGCIRRRSCALSRRTVLCRMHTTCTFGWNRYAYIRHNPMIYTDPSGHILFVPFLIKGAILLAKAAPVAVSAAAVVHKAAPTVQRIVSSPVTQQAIAKTGQAMSSAQHFANRNPQLVESAAEGTVAAAMSYAQAPDPFNAVADGLITVATGRVDSKIKQLGAENGSHKFVVGAQRVVAQGIGTGMGELSKHLLLSEPGNTVARTSGQTIAQSLAMAIPGEGAVPTALRTAVGSYGGNQVTNAIQRTSCQPGQPC